MRTPMARIGLVFAGALLLSGCKADGQRLSEILELEGDIVAGGTFFAANCATCHGADATGGGGPNIVGTNVDVVVEATLAGPGAMPAFGESSDQELADVAAYVNSL